MSEGKRMAYKAAKEISEKWLGILSPSCERVEVAGSLRRGSETVGDIEFVAIPKIEPFYDFFGELITSKSRNRLLEAVDEFAAYSDINNSQRRREIQTTSITGRNQPGTLHGCSAISVGRSVYD